MRKFGFLTLFVFILAVLTGVALDKFNFEEWVVDFIFAMVFYFWMALISMRWGDVTSLVRECPNKQSLPLSLVLIVLAIGCLTLQVEYLGWEWLLDDPGYPSYSNTSYFLSDVFLAVFCAAIVEELFFRRYLYQAFTRKLNSTMSILLVAIIFGLVHADVFGAVIFSVVLSICYLATRSLVTGIWVHAIHNGVLVSYQYFVDNGVLSDIEPTITETLKAKPFLLAAIIVLSLMLVCYFTNLVVKKSKGLLPDSMDEEDSIPRSM